MQTYKYQVIPAPSSGKRGRGAKGAAGRFANAFSELINEQAVNGWEYVCAESLPSYDRQGVLRKRVETYQNVLVFRRAVTEDDLKANETGAKGASPFRRFGKKPAAAADARVEPSVERAEEIVTETVSEAVETVADPIETAETIVEEVTEVASKAD